MRKLLLVSAATLWLAGCGTSSNNNSRSGGGAVYAPTGVWELAYSPTADLQGDTFYFPNDSQGADYLIEGPPHPVSPGQTITATFTTEGVGTLAPTEGTPPARVRVFFQRKGDDLSAQGELASYRWWSTADVELTSPGMFTLTVRLSPENWTNVYGQSGTTAPDLFNAAIAQMGNVGVTFGGQFAGHGIVATAGSVKFTMRDFSIQ